MMALLSTCLCMLIDEGGRADQSIMHNSNLKLKDKLQDTDGKGLVAGVQGGMWECRSIPDFNDTFVGVGWAIIIGN